MADVLYIGRREDLTGLAQSVAAAIAGTGPDSLQLARRVGLRVGLSLLSSVQQDFVTLSKGGAVTWRPPWKPLSPKTIAQRRITAAERKAAGLTKANRFRGLLTAEQDRRWRQIFGSVYQRLRLDIGDGPAKARAAQIAWAKLKKMGAKTKLELFGNRKVDILRDTSRLLRSLSPGPTGPTGEPDQVFEVIPGEIGVGTRVQYAEKQFRTRPWWPPDGTLPEVWAERAKTALAGGFRDAMIEAVKAGRV